LKFLFSVALFALVVAPATAQSTIPDMLGTWKGTSESVVWGAANHHHLPAQPTANSPRFHKASFTLKVTKQNGRNFYGVFSSPGGSEVLLGVISRSGSIYMADDDGYTTGTLIQPNQLEMCYLKSSLDARIASCALMTKQS
jgi:hypothetical protein